MLTNSFPFTLTKIYIKGHLSSLFTNFTHEGPMSLKESLLNRVRENPRYPKERKKSDAKEPATLHNEEE